MKTQLLALNAGSNIEAQIGGNVEILPPCVFPPLHSTPSEGFANMKIYHWRTRCESLAGAPESNN